MKFKRKIIMLLPIILLTIFLYRLYFVERGLDCQCPEERGSDNHPLAETLAETKNLKELIGDKKVHIVVDTKKNILYLNAENELIKDYPVSLGIAKTPTPLGEWSIVSKGLNWGGGFGTRWLGFNVPWGKYGIHGTNEPNLIGSPVSAGCVRMHNRHVEEIYPIIPMGTRVFVIGEYKPVKMRYTLKSGSSGKDVQFLQVKLRKLGYSPGYLDGYFGKDTETALREFQYNNHLNVTGALDKNTMVLMGLEGY
jgi:hypothetical protein